MAIVFEANVLYIVARRMQITGLTVHYCGTRNADCLSEIPGCPFWGACRAYVL